MCLALGTASALGIARFGYGLLLPSMRSDLHWSLAQAGSMTTANGIGYLAGAGWAAIGTRRWTATTTFRLGMLFTVVALAATAASSAYPALLAARFAAGLSGALVFVSGGVIASRKAAAAGSTAPILLYFAGAGLGIVASGASLPVLMERFPHQWPLAWIGLAAFAALAAAVSWTAARSDEPSPHERTGRHAVLRLWRTATAYLLFGCGYIVYITFLSATLTDRQTPPWQVAALWVLLGAGVMAAPWVWSRPIAIWPPALTLTVLLALLAGASILALVSSWPAVLAISVLTYGVSFMTVPAAVTALIRARTRPEDWMPTLANFTMLFALAQTISPWVAGAVADSTSAGATLVWTAALCSAAALFAATEKSPAENLPGTRAE
ncbi:YbfB/YjiJ family MFS transporter [Streptomyces sp. NBC_01727]|uniref:YbfB/YjiJ family MFS transporter n=1 Tax=Streptomyces sp. NBC_01727 TaxID=2975924 RepID=UPI002E10F887|nr:YbfB/YjiJ family MFS transporter [Streptomyces sp. NBC_01727]